MLWISWAYIHSSRRPRPNIERCVSRCVTGGGHENACDQINGLVCFIFVIPSDVWAWELA